jgi:hypothetical protein
MELGRTAQTNGSTYIQSYVLVVGPATPIVSGLTTSLFLNSRE